MVYRNLIADPSGARLQMPISFLDSTPFRSYLIPGALLFGAVGVSNVLAGYLALRQRRLAAISGICAGALLIGWMAVQIALLGYRHPHAIGLLRDWLRDRRLWRSLGSGALGGACPFQKQLAIN